MSIDQIQKTMDGYNRMILKVCISFVVALFIVVTGFATVLIYNTKKAYDYEYPEVTNTAISGDSNNVGGEN